LGRSRNGKSYQAVVCVVGGDCTAIYPLFSDVDFVNPVCE